MVTVSAACLSLLRRYCNAKHHLVAHLLHLEECKAQRYSKVLAGDGGVVWHGSWACSGTVAYCCTVWLAGGGGGMAVAPDGM